jgi:hypothetical protein
MPEQPTVNPTLVLVHGAAADALIAATQRPIAGVAFSEASRPPAWRRLPSRTAVATGDNSAGSDVIRSMAQRAGADIVEVKRSP